MPASWRPLPIQRKTARARHLLKISILINTPGTKCTLSHRLPNGMHGLQAGWPPGVTYYGKICFRKNQWIQRGEEIPPDGRRRWHIESDVTWGEPASWFREPTPKNAMMPASWRPLPPHNDCSLSNKLLSLRATLANETRSQCGGDLRSPPAR